jgi:nuclear migration protein JNM1
LLSHRLQTGRPLSQSTSSSYKDFDNDEDDAPGNSRTSGVFRSRLHPDEARSHFEPAQIDARDVDFSDRVTAKRKSYKASSRRQRVKEDGSEEFGDFSDDEDGEGLERKLARLRREIEEVKSEVGKRTAENATAAKYSMDLEPDVAALSKVLDGISSSGGATHNGSSIKLAKDLGTGIRANGPPQTAQATGEPATYTITYAPTYQQSHALAKAAEFDGRLAMLEKALGLDQIALNSNGTPRAVLPTLDTLQRQISLIAESTPSSLDSISRRVRSLIQDADKLQESRKAAKVAQDTLRAGRGEVTSDDDDEDSQETAKIHALYGTLPTIENLAPLLPSLLDRLRSLRAIHADAATASESLDAVEKKQIDMAEEIKKWREGLEKVESAFEENETVMSGNVKVVEGWVKELEAKMERL